jgi:DNA-binding CsgD family transcriptional regulator
MISPAVQEQLVAIHEANSLERITTAIFSLIETQMKCCLVFAAFRPLEFELPCMCSKPKYKPILDQYIQSDHVFDIWLKRSPVHPRVAVVRHSDYTPHHILVRTKFYKKTLTALDSEHGASLVVWRSRTWLATITVFRSVAQGDFQSEDIALLRSWQPHIASAIKRVAGVQEDNLTRQALDIFAEHSSVGVAILDWKLSILYFNRTARHLLARWLEIDTPKSSHAVRIPPDILETIHRLLPKIEAAKPNRPFTPRHLDLQALIKQQGVRLMAKIYFVSAKALSISKGSFLIVISESGDSLQAPDLRFDKLSLRESECVRMIGSGLTNPQIAKRLGTSRITVRNQVSSSLRKLAVKNRYEIATAVIRSGQFLSNLPP